MNPTFFAALFALLPGGDVPARPVTTYSIVARDLVTGEMGVAVQSHYFSVGPIVPWAEAGVGAVATQSLVLVDYGPNALALLRGGMSAGAALDSLRRADPNPEVRQVAIVDAHGGVAAHTGGMAIPAAGHQVGAQYSVQANLMDKPSVWPAMARAYENAKGDLAERLLAALDAAEEEGGDIRGRQSAALVVVRARSTGKPWADRIMDLRVEDHPEPLVELRRLVGLRRAYNEIDAGDAAVAAKDMAAALRHYEKGAALAPDVVELEFWAGLTLYTNGKEAEGKATLARVFAKERRWAELVPRLAKVGLFPDDPAKLAEVTKLAPKGAKW